jgi:hypothetical protein
MRAGKYSLSFTTGALLHHESVTLANLYHQYSDWAQVRAVAVAENSLQLRTLSSSKKVTNEVVSRLRLLTDAELAFLSDTSSSEQALLLWVVLCRRYTFLADFAAEVLRERYVTLKGTLSHEDYDAFFNRKAEWHPELENVTTATRSKARQVAFKMLREAGLLDTGGRIQGVMLSTRLLTLLKDSQYADTQCLPVFESDIRGTEK